MSLRRPWGPVNRSGAVPGRLELGRQFFRRTVPLELHRGDPRLASGAQIQHLDAVLENLEPDCKILVIDDIFDTGCTLQKVRDMLLEKTPHIRVATLYRKIGHNQTGLSPDYVLRETQNWIVFPHELMDLSLDEIRTKDPYIHDLLV